MSVYFIQAGGPEGPVKIGTTVGNPVLRMRKLQNGNAETLRLLVVIPGGRAEEQALLDRFHALSVRGEWLRADPWLLGFVEALRQTHPTLPPDPPFAEEVMDFEPEQRRYLTGLIRWTLLRVEIDGFLKELGIDDPEELDPDAVGDPIKVTFKGTQHARCLAFRDRLIRHAGDAFRATGGYALGLAGEEGEIARYRDIFEALLDGPYDVPGAPGEGRA